jgi:hypothetical protein
MSGQRRDWSFQSVQETSQILEADTLNIALRTQNLAAWASPEPRY